MPKDSHKLLIQPISQFEQKDCGITCVEMILKFYSKYADRETISLFINDKSKSPPAETELARFLKHKGLDVTCFSYNLYLFDPADAKLSQQKLLEKLEDEVAHPWCDEDFKKDAQSIISSIKEGIVYQIVPPSIELIKNQLDKKVPVIITVNSLALDRKQGKDPYAAHAVVLSGYDEEKFYYLNPVSGIEESLSKDEFMLAVFARKFNAIGCWMISVEPSVNNLFKSKE